MAALGAKASSHAGPREAGRVSVFKERTGACRALGPAEPAGLRGHEPGVTLATRKDIGENGETVPFLGDGVGLTQTGPERSYLYLYFGSAFISRSQLILLLPQALPGEQSREHTRGYAHTCSEGGMTANPHSRDILTWNDRNYSHSRRQKLCYKLFQYAHEDTDKLGLLFRLKQLNWAYFGKVVFIFTTIGDV